MTLQGHTFFDRIDFTNMERKLVQPPEGVDRGWGEVEVEVKVKVKEEVKEGVEEKGKEGEKGREGKEEGEEKVGVEGEEFPGFYYLNEEFDLESAVPSSCPPSFSSSSTISLPSFSSSASPSSSSSSSSSSSPSFSASAPPKDEGNCLIS